MDLNELLLKTQICFVSNPKLGTSEKIIYKFKDGTKEETRAFVQIGVYDKKSGSYKKNKKVFSSIVLSKKPTTGEIIYHNAEPWQVESGIRGDNGIYTLEAQSGVKQTMGRLNSPVRL